MKRMPIAELVLDFDLYPRSQVDSHHVTELMEAMKADVALPPILIDKKSKRVIDGFHRVKGKARADGPRAEIDVIEKSYRNEKEMLLDAIRLNAGHGRALSAYDRAHAILLGAKLGIADKALAGALSVTLDRVEGLRVSKSAKSNGATVPIKRTIHHMAGRKLTKPQVVANKKLGGMNQLFYVNQLVVLIESDLLDRENDDLLIGLRKLYELLEDIVVVK